MYSPPFGPVSAAEDEEIVRLINEARADFVWVGLGAPKQERWMAEHQGKVKGLMVVKSGPVVRRIAGKPLLRPRELNGPPSGIAMMPPFSTFLYSGSS